MRRKKIRLRYKKERVLLSDVLPYEVPFIFSNRYFYRFLVKNGVHVDGDRIVWNDNISEGALNILAIILGRSFYDLNNNGVSIKQEDLKKFISIPFTYRILHKPTKSRELSIIHPRNQILMVDFYDKYKSLIQYYCGIDKYSLRYPNKVACFFYYRDKLHKTLIGRKTDPLELFFNEYENLRTFFSYKRYNNIYKFYEDYRYQRAEKKFSHLLKFDIQNCFDSIYTHSIVWATSGGKDIYKKSFHGYDGTFGSRWDRMMQLMNYNETNGIVIGPEFSRIFAEVILQHIDNTVAHELSNNKYEWERDYVCYRYVDDYFFFFNDEECRKAVLALFDEKLKEFKLSISNEKTHVFERPFVTGITRAKIRIDDLIKHSLQYHHVAMNVCDSDLDDIDVSADFEEDDILIDRRTVEEALADESRLYLNSRVFNLTFKAILKECEVEAKDVINYTLSRIGTKLESVIKKFDRVFRVLSKALENTEMNDIRPAIVKIRQKKERIMTDFLCEVIDIVFFLYASNKRINTTLKVINILNIIIVHLNNDYEINSIEIEKYSDYIRDVVFKKIQDELSLVLKTSSVESNTQLETLYFLIVAKQLRSKYHFTVPELKNYLDKLTDSDAINALSIIILLYYYGNEIKYNTLKNELIIKIKEKYSRESQETMLKSAEYCILTLDLISCPYIDYLDKKAIVEKIGISQRGLKQMINCFKTQKYMFTKWTKIDITKELSAKISQEVYA